MNGCELWATYTSIINGEEISVVSKKLRGYQRTCKGGINVCKWCKELNEEKEKITVDTIHLHPSGYYNYYVPIYYCPACGTRLKKYEGYTTEQLKNGCAW